MMPYLIGSLKDSYGYFYVDLFFIIACMVVFILRVLLWRWDKKQRNLILESKESVSLFDSYIERKRTMS